MLRFHKAVAETGVFLQQHPEKQAIEAGQYRTLAFKNLRDN